MGRKSSAARRTRQASGQMSEARSQKREAARARNVFLIIFIFIFIKPPATAAGQAL
jgi:hypothetical protein